VSDDKQIELRPATHNALLARTPARLLVGRAGPSFRTATQLELRADHAAARDAVHTELDRQWLADLGVQELGTRAASRAEHLLRPDLGRRLSDSALRALESFPKSTDFQLVIGDGLSATAVVRQVPALLQRLAAAAADRGWRIGRSFAIRYCRVAVLNDVGEALDPTVVVLLIGERPGLATAESLSAYLAYRPRTGHSDAQRNLISNIHDRGVKTAEASQRILALADAMRRQQTSGVTVKETLGDPPAQLGPAT
jgi:ethanolamine ammonia-lyase small subunit